mmetsp:Transcript_21536/g.65825  ORF Transcript_21536/g.65825 Transcript_21536/m.65825 type:complete len:267 (-) Transcript_21536:86-886(-)
MLQLYHINKFRSTRVLWLVAELAQLYRLPPVVVHEFVDVAAFRNDKPDWLLEMNPNGKVPTVVREDGHPLFEGCAIMLSLLDRFDANQILLPADSRDLFYQMALYCSGTVDNVTAMSTPLQRAANIASGGGPANLAPPVDETRRIAWDTYIGPFLEDVVARTPGDYLAGDTFTAADIVLGMTLYNLEDGMIKRGGGTSWVVPNSTPRVHRLAQLLKERPARSFAFSATLSDEATLKDKAGYGVCDWVVAQPPLAANAGAGLKEPSA